MTSQQSLQLFRPFSQADETITRRFGGTGLGVAISKRMAVLMGGDITFTSEAGKGSVFTVTIPTGPIDPREMRSAQLRDAAPLPPFQSHVPSRTPPRLLGLRVLLAEDSADNQRLLSFHLTKAGAVVAIADSGAKAVALLTVDGDTHSPALDPPPVRRRPHGHADARDGWIHGHSPAPNARLPASPCSHLPLMP